MEQNTYNRVLKVTTNNFSALIKIPNRTFIFLPILSLHSTYHTTPVTPKDVVLTRLDCILFETIFGLIYVSVQLSDEFVLFRISPNNERFFLGEQMLKVQVVIFGVAIHIRRMFGGRFRRKLIRVGRTLFWTHN